MSETKPTPGPFYRLDAGRAIVALPSEVPVATLHRVGNDQQGYTTTPTEADDLAHRIVDRLNTHHAARGRAMSETKATPRLNDPHS